MHGSQGIMVDNHASPSGSALGSQVVIYHNSHGYCASTDLYPNVDWSMAPLHRNKYNFDGDKKESSNSNNLLSLLTVEVSC